jgi:phospholipid/cholesterol/gamma-HCH transport system substrate-binding protein
MRRAIAICVVVAGIVGALAAFAPFGGGGSDYVVRAYFDNGDFVVNGEDVRIAGAKVGSVSGEAVSFPGEPVHADGKPDPGKAVIELTITDAGFQDFRKDASCIIRPQSLLGEKFIDCSPTKPRAPDTPEPPPLKKIPSDAKYGAGQYFLPLENNGHIVDIDLVQNINRLPFADRFRLILNELGAGLAARGQTLNAVIKRADPALRWTDQVLHILASQNHVLANLARDSQTVLGPLARERRHVSGFIANAGATAKATAEQSTALEAGFQKFPLFLRNLQSTNVQLKNFADQATPTLADLGAAAPTLTKLTRKTAPFASATEKSLLSLGDAAAKSTKPLVKSDPVVIDLRNLSRAAVSPSKNLDKLLSTFGATGGFQHLLQFLYNTAGSVNAFDKYGHFLRANLLVTSCVDYTMIPTTGCGANFNGAGAAKFGASTLPVDAAGSAPEGSTAAGAAPDAVAKTGSQAAAASRKPLAGAASIMKFLVGGDQGSRLRHRHHRGQIHANGTVTPLRPDGSTTTTPGSTRNPRGALGDAP